MEIAALFLSVVSLIAATFLAIALLRARSSLRGLRQNSSRQHKELTERVKAVERRLSAVEGPLRTLSTDARRLANDQNRIIERLRVVERDRTTLKRDLDHQITITQRVSDDVDFAVTWIRKFDGRGRRRSSLPSGPKPELRLRNDLESIRSNLEHN